MKSAQLAPEGCAWANAKDYGPSIQGVADSLERLGDALDLPKAEFGPEVPFFERRADQGPERKRRLEREGT